MARKPASKPADSTAQGDFESLVISIVEIHQKAQDFSTKAVNVGLTLRNWLIGWRIEVYERERQGADRAIYGEKLMDSLAKRLAEEGWKRCDRRELYRFRQLYLTYPKIVETLSPQSPTFPNLGALLGLLPSAPSRILETVSPRSLTEESRSRSSPDILQRLSFSHLAELLELPDDTQRRFYEVECIRGNWSVRELRRQIDSLYYERSGLPKNRYYKRHEMTAGDQPPVGILLCTRKNQALVEFALGDLSNKLFVSRYAVEMPKKTEMERFLKELGREIGNDD